MSHQNGTQGIGAIGGAAGVSAATSTQAPQARPAAAAAPRAVAPPQTAASPSDSFALSDEAEEEVGGSVASAQSDSPTRDAKPSDDADDDKSATSAEEKKRAEEDEKKREIEALQKKIDELQKKLEKQKADGDASGARQTQGELDAARTRLDTLTQPQGAANPVQAVDSAGGGPAGGPGGGFQSDPVPTQMPPSHPYYNPGPAGSPTGTGGAQAPGGPSAPGTSAGPGANAQPIRPEDLQRGTPMGQEIAKSALAKATDGTGDGGHCYRAVGEVLRKFGIQTSGMSAYMAADQLAQSDKLKEVSGVSQDDLKKLPPGAVVVWNRGGGHEHGHISIALGDGREASDVMRQQITNYGTSYRVFLPNDR